MADEKRCNECKYFHTDDEYWHDHYFIPRFHYCTFESQYDKKEVKPDGCCENFESRYKSRKKSN